MHNWFKTSSLLVTILLSHFCKAQKSHGDSLFNQFKKDIQVELERSGEIDWDDETKQSYYTLMTNCPIESLVKYVDDSIPAIRGIIFIGLAQKNADRKLLAEIFSKHRNDSARYTEGSTDVKMIYTVRNFMEMVVRWKQDEKIPSPNFSFAQSLERLKEERNKFHIIIPGKYHGIVAKESLLALDSLSCSLKGYRVISFYLTKNGVDKVTSDNFFNEEIKQLIISSQSGDLLQFGNMIVEGPDKVRKKYPSIALKVN